MSYRHCTSRNPSGYTPDASLFKPRSGICCNREGVYDDYLLEGRRNVPYAHSARNSVDESMVDRRLARYPYRNDKSRCQYHPCSCGGITLELSCREIVIGVVTSEASCNGGDRHWVCRFGGAVGTRAVPGSSALDTEGDMVG